MILADTSVWVDHLRRQNPEMAQFLLQGQIAMHPSVVDAGRDDETGRGGIGNSRT
jgi:predicted nucleic acid-binding protein